MLFLFVVFVGFLLVCFVFDFCFVCWFLFLFLFLLGFLFIVRFFVCLFLWVNLGFLWLVFSFLFVWFWILVCLGGDWGGFGGSSPDPLSYFPFHQWSTGFQWCTKGRCMYYPVCEMMHIKQSLLLIGNSSPCGGSGFPLSLSEWSITIICLTPYNHK